LALGQLGLNIDYFYSLTLRQFTNIVNGYRKKEDILSRERWQIARKIMYASLAPNLDPGTTEETIITFPWEKEMIENATVKNKEEMLQELEEVRLFWEKQDAKQMSS